MPLLTRPPGGQTKLEVERKTLYRSPRIYSSVARSGVGYTGYQASPRGVLCHERGGVWKGRKSQRRTLPLFMGGSRGLSYKL